MGLPGSHRMRYPTVSSYETFFMTSERDPWADLAESLGASPGAEPQHPRAVEPPRPRPAKQPSRPRPQAATGGDWDGLASNLLGVDGDRPAASEPSEPAREPAPARSRVEQPPARERRAEQRHEEPITTSAWADEVLADTGNQAESPSGERGNRGDRDESGDGRERRGRRRRAAAVVAAAAMASARQRTRLTTVMHPAKSPMSSLVPENRVQRTVTMTVTTAATTLPATPRRRRRARALVIARRDVGGAADAAVGGEAAAPVNGSPESVSLPNSLSRNNAWTIW